MHILNVVPPPGSMLSLIELHLCDRHLHSIQEGHKETKMSTGIVGTTSDGKCHVCQRELSDPKIHPWNPKE